MADINEVLPSLPVGLFQADRDGRVTAANAAFGALVQPIVILSVLVLAGLAFEGAMLALKSPLRRGQVVNGGVLLEVGGQWLLVGVAPGQVNTLLQLPEPPTNLPTPSADPRSAANNWLNTYLNRHHER